MFYLPVLLPESYNLTNVKNEGIICSTVNRKWKVKYSHITHILQVIHAHNMLTKVKKRLGFII